MEFLKSKAWPEFKTNPEAYLALLFGIIGALIGILGGSTGIVVATTSGVLTLIAFAILNDRKRQERLADTLDRIDADLDRPVSIDLDDVLQDRSEYPKFKDRLKGKRTLWIYGASAINILSDENLQAIREEILNHKDGELRVIIQDPEQKVAMEILKKQLDDSVDYPVQYMHEAVPETLKRLNAISTWKCPGTFKYGLLAYNPGFSLVVIDPVQSNGVVIPEIYAYHNEHTGSRMHIEITRDLSLRWYDYWVSQFDYMWDEARKPGKTDESAKS